VRSLLVALAAATAVAAAAAAPTATAATHECDGLQICVPIVGPWVVVPGASAAPLPVEFQLDCPRGYIVGGLDAELSAREIDLSFAGSVGSPVNPGITTARSAVFTATYVGQDPSVRPTFRPHIGCIPTSGGGGRTPTSVTVTTLFRPGHPTVRRVRNVLLLPGTGRIAQTCAAGERLIGAAAATGFLTKAPPTRAQVDAVHATLAVTGRRASVLVRATAVVRTTRAMLQVGAVCAGGR
jgi:hypothetical protein